MPCRSEFHRPIGQYLKYFLVLVTCLQLARCLQLSCNLLAHTRQSQDDHMEVWTWLLWLAGRFSSPKHLPRNAHPHPFLCGDAYGTAFWALHLWYLCHYSNSLGWFVLAFFCHMAQGMLSNAGSSELSLHLRAGRASQILNKHLHESLQVNQESQPSSALFQACKDFFFPSLPWRKFISEYCWNSRSLICLSPKNQRYKRGIKDTEHANNQMFSHAEERLLLVTHPRTRRH